MIRFLSPSVCVAGLLLASCAPSEAAPAHANSKAAQWEPDCPQQIEGGDQPAVREELWNKRKDAEPLCLFVGAIAWAHYDSGKATELYALGMIRRRYDLGRCVNAPGGMLSSMMAAVRMGAGDKLRESGILVGPAQIRPFALDPATYRYRTDHLASTCEGSVKPSNTWAAEQEQMQREIANHGPHSSS